jgi:hypothetical protein
MAGSFFLWRGLFSMSAWKVLGFSGASVRRGHRGVRQVRRARSCPICTVPFIGRERGENSGALWHAHSGHKLKLKKTPPAPGLSPGGGEVKRAHPLPGPLPPAGEGITRACFNGKPPLIRPFGTPSPTDGRRKMHTHPLPTSPLPRGRGPQSHTQKHMGWKPMLQGQPRWSDVVVAR